MTGRSMILCVAICFASVNSVASGTGSETTTLILVDASPAMSSRLGTQTRFDLTARALDRLIRSSKSNENIEILTYGYGDKEACQGVTLDSPIASDDRALLEAQLNCVRPNSKLPLDLVLSPQINRFMEIGRVAKIVIVSGGYELFETDPCSTRKDLDESLRRNIRLSVVEIGREDRFEASTGLECLAESFAGQFRRVDDEDSLYRTILNFTDSGARSRINLSAAFKAKEAIDDATMLWQVVPIISSENETKQAGYQPIESTGASFEPVLYWGDYSVRVEGESFSGIATISVTEDGPSAFEIPLECFPGHHTDSDTKPTTCFNDLEFQSCGPSRMDCRELVPGRGYVTCNGERCDVVCEDGFHTDSEDAPSICLEDTNLKSCGIHRLDCTETTVLGGQVGCDGAICTLECEFGKYPSERAEREWSCEDNVLMCEERALRTQRGFWASVGGGATAIGSLGLFISQRLAAAELRDDVNSFNAGEVRPRVEQVDLLDRGRTIGALESTSLTLLSAGLVALGYAGWEYFMSPSDTTFACSAAVSVPLGQFDTGSEEPKPDEPVPDGATP